MAKRVSVPVLNTYVSKIMESCLIFHSNIYTHFYLYHFFLETIWVYFTIEAFFGVCLTVPYFIFPHHYYLEAFMITSICFSEQKFIVL